MAGGGLLLATRAGEATAVDITDFGAVGDGIADCTDAFRRAILRCHASGGGRVVVPPGRFLTGPIHLRSNLELHISAGATVLFKTDPAAYLPVVMTRWEGTECYNYSPFTGGNVERDALFVNMNYHITDVHIRTAPSPGSPTEHRSLRRHPPPRQRHHQRLGRHSPLVTSCCGLTSKS